MTSICREYSLQLLLGMVLLIGALAVPPAFADHHKAAEKSLYEHFAKPAPIAVVVNDFLDLMIPAPN